MKPGKLAVLAILGILLGTSSGFGWNPSGTGASDPKQIGTERPDIGAAFETDFPGNDFRRIQFGGNPSGRGYYAKCHLECRLDKRCQAWTYVYPNMPGAAESNVCYLKTGVASRIHNLGTASGTRPEHEGAMFDIDIQGNDYQRTVLDIPEYKICQDSCQRDSGCKAWTYVRPGHAPHRVPGEEGKAICYLKNAVSAQRTEVRRNVKCCISGIKSDLDYLEVDTDRAGQDFRRTLLEIAEPNICRSMCLSEEACQSWTYVKPGMQDLKPICYLKNGVPEPKINSCCVSGVK